MLSERRNLKMLNKKEQYCILCQDEKRGVGEGGRHTKAANALFKIDFQKLAYCVVSAQTWSTFID